TGSFSPLKPAVDAIYAPTVPDRFTGPRFSVFRLRRCRARVGLLYSLARNVREKLRNCKALSRRKSRPLRFHFSTLQRSQNRLTGHFAQHRLQRGISIIVGPVTGLAGLDKKKMAVTRLSPSTRAYQKQKQHSRETE